MNIHAGTSGFAHGEWKGAFYPDKIPASEMLRFYSTLLGTVEINNTFYHMPRESVLRAWAAQVRPDFLFAVKAPQVITHVKQLRNVFEETDYFFRTLSVLDRRLGPILFQFPKSFHPDMSALKDFLGLIPHGVACAFEFRHPAWIAEGAADLLREKGCSLCIADTDEQPAAEIINTASWGYLRLRRRVYAENDLTTWLARISAQGWERAFVYFKHEEEARGAELAMRLQQLADTAGGAEAKNASARHVR